jgi:hypothetical protein
LVWQQEAIAFPGQLARLQIQREIGESYNVLIVRSRCHA